MFGVGGSELIVILVIALIFLGPDKLPDAAKQISKGIRDLKKQSRILQEQIENDEHIGGALRDIKSALRGDEAPVRPAVKPKPAQPPAATLPEGVVEAKPDGETPALEEAKPAVTLPPTAGEHDGDGAAPQSGEPGDLAALIKPAAGTVAKGESAPEPETAPVEPHQKHG